MYLLTINKPGYLPEEEPEIYDDETQARAAMIDELTRTSLTISLDDTAELDRALAELGDQPIGPRMPFTIHLGGYAHSLTWLAP
jgi:hypothetical protein